ncbi:uncharacterized protein SETTUDRAFT_165001 [Exserohilum turcica Et28A]|uniref:Uncharacterized protein n=1 Tax=Exserohilum turcicum (strain 28A) TaxID=671987 RepID=R0JYA3_EXST2|nr:uncharacterized protein SETTUDRAFT_165001 [Exserohilum turcica Et28A]EOA82459.1 hypothetical protein SETTUDRAFT_165001 [Exserohilum turcica Et28A]
METSATSAAEYRSVRHLTAPIGTAISADILIGSDCWVAVPCAKPEHGWLASHWVIVVYINIIPSLPSHSLAPLRKRLRKRCGSADGKDRM